MEEDNQPVQYAAQPQPHFNPVQVPLPDRFDFTSPDTWPAWVRRFDRFRVASGLCNRPANDHISTMVYAMGDQAEDILNTVHVADDASYEQLKQTLDAYFGVRRNLIIERAKFNRRTQQPGESVDVFIQELYRLAEHCDYGVLREQLIRDRIVVGVIDDALSDRLQAQADLTLDQSVQLSRQAEARKLQRNVVRGGDTKFNPTTVEMVKRGQRSTGKHSAATPKHHAGKCKWCSQQQHDRKVCPARQAICHNCQKPGYFSSVCRSSPQIKPRGSKTAAIAHFPAPTTVAELQRFLGMVNQMGKFIPRLAEINKPLRQLLCKDTAWLWEASQETAFQQVKDMLVSPEILAHYDPDRPTVIAANASSERIGAVLLQIQDDGRRRPVCYASRSLTDTEKRYAVIEKEVLAATWACEKFREYVMGLSFTLETDHKPLVPLLKSTELSKMPPRIQRFRMRLMRYSPEVAYASGKQQTTPDALSRAPVNIPEKTDVMFLEEVEHYATTTVTLLPATEKRLQDISTAQKDDEVCAEVRRYCHEGWPAFMPQIPLLRAYWESRSHLAIINDLLLYDERIVMPRCMRLDTLKIIHEGHLGISQSVALEPTKQSGGQASPSRSRRWSRLATPVRRCGQSQKRL